MPLTFELTEIENLMPMPISSVRLAEIVAEPDSTVLEFTRVIELDQALTVNVLHWANSPYSAPQTRINTVRDAVVRLGTANILKLAVGQHLLAAFSPSLSKTDFGENELWRHSVASGLAAESLHQAAKVQIPGLAFTAALIHDVGKLIISRRLGYDTFQEIIRGISEEKKMDVLAAEREVLQTDHAEIGGAMARHWKFSGELIAAIEKHHCLDVEQGVLLDTVIVSDVLAHNLDRNCQDELLEISRHLQRLQISAGQLGTLADSIRREMNKSESLWNAPAR